MTPNEALIWFIAMALAVITILGGGILAAAGLVKWLPGYDPGNGETAPDEPDPRSTEQGTTQVPGPVGPAITHH
jgi:hypothetical protein